MLFARFSDVDIYSRVCQYTVTSQPDVKFLFKYYTFFKLPV